MAMYSPIRDAFKDLNELMKDSRQWNERHSAQTADREFKQQMLMSELTQRQFNNKMAIQEFGLRQQGETRLADQSAFNRMHTNRQWEADKLSAGEDTQLHKARMEKIALETEDAEIDLEQKKANLAARNGLLAKTTKEIFQDPVSRATEEGAALAQQLKGLETRRDKLRDSRLLPFRAGIGKQINAKKAELEEVTSAVATPEAKIKTWRTQADKARELALVWYDKNRSSEGDALMKIADDYDERADAELEASAKSQAAASKLLEKDQWDKRYDRFMDYWADKDPVSGNFLKTPSVQGRVAIAQDIATRLSKEGKLTHGELFLSGLKRVDDLERKLAQKVETLKTNEAEIDKDEVLEMIQDVIAEYKDMFGYVPDNLVMFERESR